MYNIMTEKEGDYLYLEAGTPVLKEWSDVSSVDGAWERLGIGVIEPPPASDWTDEEPWTSDRDWTLTNKPPPASDWTNEQP